MLTVSYIIGFRRFTSVVEFVVESVVESVVEFEVYIYDGHRNILLCGVLKCWLELVRVYEWQRDVAAHSQRVARRGIRK